MKDTVAIGTVAGLIGGTVGLAYSYSMFYAGISPMASLHLAASLVVMDILNLTPGGIIWSVVTHLSVSVTFSILLTHILIRTGKEYWALKGVGFGAIFCLIAHSYLIPLMRNDLRELIFNAPSFGTMITTHALIGFTASFVIVRYFYFTQDQ